MVDLPALLPLVTAAGAAAVPKEGNTPDGSCLSPAAAAAAAELAAAGGHMRDEVPQELPVSTSSSAARPVRVEQSTIGSRCLLSSPLALAVAAADRGISVAYDKPGLSFQSKLASGSSEMAERTGIAA